MPRLWLVKSKINLGAEEANSYYSVPSIAARISRSRSIVDKVRSSAVMVCGRADPSQHA
jgi:hypothetical protein